MEGYGAAKNTSEDEAPLSPERRREEEDCGSRIFKVPALPEVMTGSREISPSR
jgi:hypothetical protein